MLRSKVAVKLVQCKNDSNPISRLYRVWRNAPLRHLILDYSSYGGVAFNFARSLYQRLLSLCGLLEMKNGDDIDDNIVTVADTDAAARESTLICLQRVNEEEESVVVKVHDLIKDVHSYYWIGRDTPFHNLMLDYAPRNGHKHTRLFYYGKFINPNETAHDLGIENGNVILAIDS